MAMDINLRIEHLLLEGVNLSRSQRLSLQTEIAQELSRLLGDKGLPNHLQNGGAIANLPTKLSVPPHLPPHRLGRQIAQSIYTELGSSQQVHRPQ